MWIRQVNRKRSSGFIKAIIIIVIALIVLGYFGFNVAEIVKQPTVKGNLDFAYNGAKYVWSNYLSGPASTTWAYMVANVKAHGN